MFNTSSVCSVNHSARALVSQRACKDQHRFIVGTYSMHEPNELSMLQYYDDSNHFDTIFVYDHPDEILAVESSPSDPSLVLTSRQNRTGFKSVTLWRMPYQSADEIADDATTNFSYHITQERVTLEEKATFNQSQQLPQVTSLRWHPQQNQLLTVDQKVASAWKIGESTVEKSSAMILGYDHHGEGAVMNGLVASSSRLFGGCATWDPHNVSLAAVAFDHTLQIVDTSKDMEIIHSLPFAHDDTIRDIDYNPNKPQTLATCGDDRQVKFWDVRKLDKPLMTLMGHSHWVWSTRYNPFHDQLVLSGGSDHMVNLWRVASCSSSPWIGAEDDTNDDPADIKVRAIDQHEDSVYAVAWSAADAWIYASLSQDGRVIINHVPSTEKYKILL